MNSTMFYLPLLLPPMLMIINKMLSWKSTTPKNLNSPFECGFNNMSHLQIPLANTYFNFNLLFIILELEILLVIPFTYNKNKAIPIQWAFFSIIILILTSLMIEWKNKMMDWNK